MKPGAAQKCLNELWRSPEYMAFKKNPCLSNFRHIDIVNDEIFYTIHIEREKARDQWSDLDGRWAERKRALYEAAFAEIGQIIASKTTEAAKEKTS